MALWMSGLVSGLQNHIRWFDSNKSLKRKGNSEGLELVLKTKCTERYGNRVLTLPHKKKY